MAKTHVQEGKIMTWTNGTGSAVAAGDVVVVGLLVGVALGDIANGATGEVAIEEVWLLPKDATVAIAQGAASYWDVADGKINATAEDNYFAGVAFAAAAETDTTIKVKLGAYGLLTNLA